MRAALTGIVLLIIPAALLAEPQQAPFVGRPVAQVIDQFRSEGYPFAYSTNLVDEHLRVIREPTATEPLQLVRQILAPHALGIRQEQGYYLVVRAAAESAPTGALLLIVRSKADARQLAAAEVSGLPALPDAETLAPGIRQFSGLTPQKYRVTVGANGFEPAASVVEVSAGETAVVELALSEARPEIESITVSASRYDLWQDLSSSPHFVDQRSIQNLPDLGDDPLRAVQRLPGAASNGLSARTHFRGGQQNEIGILLNGHKLVDPFHARDFQQVFSVVDSRVVDGVEVYTGGFPVQYGDQTSGLIMMETIDNARTEVGVSVFNTSLLTAGPLAGGKGRWLLSGRRGNLDLIIDPEFGTPSYADLFAQVSFELTPDAELSFNALYAHDRLSVVLANSEEELERAESDTDNAQFWLRLKNRWSEDLSSSSLLSFASYSNDRRGILDDAPRISAVIDDARDMQEFGFRQDWRWLYSDAHLFGWGFEFGYGNADYRYRSEVDHFGQPPRYAGIPLAESRDLQAAPQGASYAFYVSDKWQLRERTFLELGLRFDEQGYTDLPSDVQLSPRISLFHAFENGLEFRLGWGRYHQSQGLLELQIEDGVTDFFQAEQADHIIAGIRYRAGQHFDVRLEAFHKKMPRLRPRFENLFDPLELLPEVEADRIRVAPDATVARGLELMLEFDPAGPWSWWASYSLSDVTDTIDGTEQARSWDQRHALQAGVNRSSRKWDFGLATNLHTGWPTTDMSLSDGSLIPGPRNALQFSVYATVDARLSRRFTIGDNLLTTFIEVTNVLDRKNPCCVDFDLEVDDDGTPLLLRQEDNWLPLIPAIGFLLEF